MEPPVWNQRTGSLVGGHQRLGALDAIAGTDDYMLDVSVIDVPLAREKELNLLLNNPAVQGQWDTDALFEMLQQDREVDFTAAGFETLELELLLGEDHIKELLDRSSIFDAPSNEAVLAAEEQDVTRKDREIEKAAKAAAEEARKQTPEYIEEQKQAKHGGSEKRDDQRFYSVVVFLDSAGREEFEAIMGYNPGEKYCDGQRLLQQLRPVR